MAEIISELTKKRFKKLTTTGAEIISQIESLDNKKKK
jgi:hypothetical protein